MKAGGGYRHSGYFVLSQAFQRTMDIKPTRYLAVICLWQASEHLS